ncbi:MAG: hypothetical protein U5N86_02560 [Planctomycetota bacterium]|nr:hypothetical protein [Planctomycetota bacterium]
MICKYENSTCERKIPQSCIDESEIFSLEIFKITGKRNAHSSGFHNAQE